MSILINLDDSVEVFSRVVYVQDFREVHSTCWLIFGYPELFNFAAGNTFVFQNIEWEAASYRRVYLNGFYMYSVLAYPREVCTRVEERCSCPSELASAVGVSLAEGSEDIPFEFPIHNVTLGVLLRKYRYESMEKNRDNLGESVFLFYGRRGLVCRSLSSLVRDGGKFFPDATVSMFSRFSFVRDKFRSLYNMDPFPARLKYKSLANRLIGDKVSVTTNALVDIGGRYSLKSGEEDLDSLDRLILVKQKYDSGKSKPDPCVLTFGQLEV